MNNCGVLAINSGSPDSSSPVDDVWTARMIHPILGASHEPDLVWLEHLSGHTYYLLRIWCAH